MGKIFSLTSYTAFHDFPICCWKAFSREEELFSLLLTYWKNFQSHFQMDDCGLLFFEAKYHNIKKRRKYFGDE